MSKKDLGLIVALVLVIIGIAAAGFFARQKAALPGTGGTTQTATSTNERPAVPEIIPAFTPEVPKNAALTPPAVDIKPDPGETKRQGFYGVKATKNGYDPAVLTVGRGNIVTIDFTAVDNAYDMFSESFGFYITAPKGETKQISFKAGTVGSFLFECRDHCPSGGKIQGQLIVIP
ncbi:MAG: cupredoxin domain-containing protein [Candidatus Jorgensenbacteria bacterium]|nr:cupredoxin domain-containing protein [Candidatus Jorgensenbacteria bacterium]